MKMMFVWQSVEGLTMNWHSEGGCLVIADSLEAARNSLKNCEGVHEECEAFTMEPDYSAMVDENLHDKVFIFPDAGCC